MKIENNEWMLLNSIIYQINSIDSLTVLRKKFLESLRFLIPYDQALFFLADPSNESVIGTPVGVNINMNKVQDYLKYWAETDNLLWLSALTKSIVYIESELLSADIMEKEAKQSCYIPENIFFSMGVFFAYDNKCLGSAHLFRKRNEGDFTPRDKFMIEVLKEHMELRLHKENNGIPYDSHKEKGLMDVHYYSKKYNLTLKEMEIIQLFLRGYGDSQICETLFISVSTFKKHISSIYKKMKVKNRKELFEKTI